MFLYEADIGIRLGADMNIVRYCWSRTSRQAVVKDPVTCAYAFVNSEFRHICKKSTLARIYWICYSLLKATLIS